MIHTGASHLSAPNFLSDAEKTLILPSKPPKPIRSNITYTGTGIFVMQSTFSVALKNSLKALTHLMADVNAFLKPHTLTAKVVNAVDLVLEEVLLNIIKYGYEDGAEHTIAVHLQVNSDDVAIRVEDDGRAFNPLTVPRQDRSKPAMERIEDGLGIHLVRNIMRSMSYRRVEDKNIFEIWVNR